MGPVFAFPKPPLENQQFADLTRTFFNNSHDVFVKPRMLEWPRIAKRNFAKLSGLSINTSTMIDIEFHKFRLQVNSARISLIRLLPCLILVGICQSQTAPPQKDAFQKEATISEDQGTVHIVASNARPLAQALDALQKKYGWVVGYEDPRYVSKVDVTEQVDALHGPKPRLVPVGGRFEASFPMPTGEVSAEAAADTEEKALRLVVEAYNHSNNAGQFEARKSSQGNFFVEGIAAHDSKGAIAPQKAIFDTPVTLVRAKRNGTDTIQLICRRVTARTGVPVNLGVSPRVLLDHNPVTVGGTKVAARDLLLQILSQTRGNCYWRLLFDPDSKGYFLDIHAIPVAKAQPATPPPATSPPSKSPN